MTSTAALQTLRELDEQTRAAWARYRERLRDLGGEEYERTESAAWAELQDTLRPLHERRAQTGS